MGETTVRLADGVVIGHDDNPVVVVPDRGVVAIDAETHRFLRALVRGDRVVTASGDPETEQSLSLLGRHGIIAGVPGVGPAPATYAPTLTDLFCKRRSEWLSAVVRRLSAPLRPITSAAGCALGMVQLVGWTLWALLFLPVGITLDAVAGNPIRTALALTAAIGSAAVLHEAGHYGVASRCGYAPDVGFGLYLFGPVLYVDLSPLEAERRTVRIRGALAGPAVDGCCCTIVAAAYLLTDTGLAAVVLVVLCSTSVASLRPTEKSDGYWALRDGLRARRVAATWASPIALYRCARSGAGQPRSFAGLSSRYMSHSRCSSQCPFRDGSSTSPARSVRPESGGGCSRFSRFRSVKSKCVV